MEYNDKYELLTEYMHKLQEHTHKLQMDMARQISSRILEWQEAAIFESLVVAKLAYLAEQATDSNNCFDCPCTQADVCYAGICQECRWIFLKTARLQVEEEMDEEK